jgi:cell division protein FtsB
VTRKKRQRILSTPKVVAIVTFTLVAVLSVDFGRKALDNYQIQRQVEWLSQQVAVERETNQALQETLQYVESDAYVEKVARESLKLVKQGEVAVVVVHQAESPPPASSDGQATLAPGEEPVPYWQQWTHLLLGSAQ